MFLRSAPLELRPLLARVESPARGGIACFLGTVRDHQNGRKVLRLEYSAYAPMAELECGRIVAETEERWDCAIALEHRIGMLELGETAVAIVAASPHRDEAFAACRYAIEQLKLRVPIWKKEFFVDGTVEWVGGGEARQVGSAAGDTGVVTQGTE